MLLTEPHKDDKVAGALAELAFVKVSTYGS